MLETINPATESLIETYDEHSRNDVEQRITGAHEAFQRWRETAFADRAAKMNEVAALLRAQQFDLAKLMSQEMGKPVVEGEAEVEKCAWVCEYYAEMAEDFLRPEPVETGARATYVRFDPVGPVLAIMPWNFPLWQVYRFLAPALMAGNTGLLKHAANVTGCALAIERIMREAGFPAGAFATLLMNSKRVAAVIEHPLVRAVTLTGSEGAGRAVGERAGQSVKKCVLELGGSDPFIVLDDADVENTARQAAKARTINAGQSCIAAKRFLVAKEVVTEFTEAFVTAMEQLVIGDPMERGTQIGPLARKDLVDDLHEQVRSSVDTGAHVATGGTRLDRQGYFYAPTVLTDVKPGMPAFDDELFGPVAAVITVDSADHAVALANQSKFGLGASVWTADSERGKKLAARLDSGAVFVNAIVKSDPRLPFGGVKCSGFGRELSRFGIREFVNIKSVWID